MTEVLGRDAEAQQIGQRLGRARHGRGGALLILGEPGIGKTTLLRSATDEPAGMRLVRVNGFEAESQMPFAAVQRLVMPLREFLPALPERHLRVLEWALKHATGVSSPS
jgi:predicted ATP-dependent serine protease